MQSHKSKEPNRIENVKLTHTDWMAPYGYINQSQYRLM